MFESVIGALVNWLPMVMTAIGAFFVARFFGERKAEQLKNERDTALADARAQSIKAEAKAHEAEKRQEQQKTEDAIHAANSSDIADRLDGMFR